MNRPAFAVLAPLVLVAGCSGGSSGTDPGAVADLGTTTAAGSPSAQTAEVDGKDTLKFGPNIVDAKVGALALTFRNAGQVPHNLVFDDAGLGKTGTVNGGARQVLSLRFDKVGTFTFQCTFHPGMTGKVVVS